MLKRGIVGTYHYTEPQAPGSLYAELERRHNDRDTDPRQTAAAPDPGLLLSNIIPHMIVLFADHVIVSFMDPAPV